MHFQDINPKKWDELIKLQPEDADERKGALLQWDKIVQMQTPETSAALNISEAYKGYETAVSEKSVNDMDVGDRSIRFLIVVSPTVNGYYTIQQALVNLMLIDLAYLQTSPFCTQITLQNLLKDTEGVPLGDPMKSSCHFILTLPLSFKRCLKAQQEDIAFLIALAEALVTQEGIIEVTPDLPAVNQVIPLQSFVPGCNVPDDDAPPNTNWALKMICYDKIPAPKPTGAGIIIGQIDTGFTYHNELNVGDTYDLNRSINVIGRDKRGGNAALDNKNQTWSHGTGTGSIISSQHGTLSTDEKGQPRDGVNGIAPGSKIIPVRAFDSVVTTWWSRDIIDAVQYLIDQKCHIITMSFGGFLPRAAEDLLETAWRNNIILCAAAGNCVPWVVEPANYDFVIACGGVGLIPNTTTPRIWRGSSQGGSVDICAPAENVYLANWRHQRDSVLTSQGTSFASPHVAGAAALWLEKHGCDTLIDQYAGTGRKLNDIFREVMQSSAYVPPGWDSSRNGTGILDVTALLAAPLP